MNWGKQLLLRFKKERKAKKKITKPLTTPPLGIAAPSKPCTSGETGKESRDEMPADLQGVLGVYPRVYYPTIGRLGNSVWQGKMRLARRAPGELKF